MKKHNIFIFFIMIIFVLTSCSSDNHKYTGVDLANKPLPWAPHTKYLYFNSGLYFISDEVVGDDVYKGRIGRKIGSVGDVSHKLLNEGDVAVVDPDHEEIKRGDAIIKVSDISKNLVVLIKTKKGYYYCEFITKDKIK